MNIELKITIITAVITGIKWVYEYTKQLTWEKNRFLLDRLDLFKNKENTKKMQLLLDWNDINIEIGEKRQRVDDEILLGAFITHNKKSSFTTLEFELRSIFDEYFDDLNEFIVLCETGLIDKENLKIYMKYWFDILTHKKNSKSLILINKIHEYLDYYGYKDLYNFLNYEY